MDPVYDPATGTIRIPKKAGVIYSINGKPVHGLVNISGPTKVSAALRGTARFREGTTTEWYFGSDLTDPNSTMDDDPSIEDDEEPTS